MHHTYYIIFTSCYIYIYIYIYKRKKGRKKMAEQVIKREKKERGYRQTLVPLTIY